MIAVDTSALMAVLLDEPTAGDCAEILVGQRCAISAVFGDCFAYDLAKTNDCPLLYVGLDFGQTDISKAT